VNSFGYFCRVDHAMTSRLKLSIPNEKMTGWPGVGGVLPPWRSRIRMHQARQALRGRNI